MNKPHVHKDLIIAWANNPSLVIQWYHQGTWEDCAMDYPAWNTGFSYRIKPEELKVTNTDTHIEFSKGNEAICIRHNQMVQLTLLAIEAGVKGNTLDWVTELRDLLQS